MNNNTKLNKSIKLLQSWNISLDWGEYFDDELYNMVSNLGYEWDSDRECWCVFEHYDCYED